MIAIVVAPNGSTGPYIAAGMSCTRDAVTFQWLQAAGSNSK